MRVGGGGGGGEKPQAPFVLGLYSVVATAKTAHKVEPTQNHSVQG